MTERRVKAVLDADATPLVRATDQGAAAFDKLGNAMDQAAAKSSKGLTGITKNANVAVEASRRLLNAQGSLAVAEQRLAEARAAGNVAGARMAGLEESVARARRNVTAATTTEAAAMDRAAAAGVVSANGITRVGRSAEDTSKHLTTLSRAGGLLGVGLAAGLGFAVKSVADFDQAMSGAAAALPDAGAQMSALRQEAIDLGAASQFSSAQAAGGITALGKAGVDAGDILSGGLKGSLDLAAAGEIDVSDAAELAASALTQFKLKGSEVPHVADLLAAGAGKAQGSVADLGMALQQSGLVASQTGLSIEEATGGLAAFASAGLTGSDAGTSFKTMLQRLVPQSAQAKDMLDKLGISAFDGQGNFVGLANYAGQLQAKLKDLTPEARSSALQIIFGSDAVRAAAVLYQQGATGVQAWIDQVNAAAFATDNAAKLTDNLRGDVEKLGGALDSAIVQNGEGANAALRGITQGLTAVVDGFTHLSPQAQQAGIYFGAGATGLLLVTAAGVKAKTMLDEVKTSFSESGLAAQLAESRFAGAGKALGIVGATITGVVAVGQFVQPMWQNISGANDDATTSLENYLAAGAKARGVSDLMSHGFDDLKGSLGWVFDDSFANHAKEFGAEVGTLAGIFGATSKDDAQAFFHQVDQGLTGLLAAGRMDEASRAFQQIVDAAKAQGISVDQVKAKLPSYAAALAAAGITAQGAADGGLTAYQQQLDGITSSGPAAGTAAASGSIGISDLGDTAKDAADQVKALQDAITGLGGGFRDERQAARDYRGALKDVDDLLKASPAVAAAQATRANANDRVAAARRNLTAVQNRKGSTTDQVANAQDRLTVAQRAATTAQEKLNAAVAKAKISDDDRQAVLDKVAQKTLGYVASAKEQGESDAAVVKIAIDGRAAFLQKAADLGLQADAAARLADKEGLIPDEVKSLVTVPTLPAETKKVTDHVGALDSIYATKQTLITAPGAVEKRRQITDLHTELDDLPTITKPRVDIAGMLTANTALGIFQANIDGLHGKTVTVTTVFDNIFDADRTARAKGLSGGGFTGMGGKFEPAGIVHRREFVHTSENTARPGMLGFHTDLWRTNNLDAAYARYKARGYAGGGYVGATAPPSSMPVGVTQAQIVGGFRDALAQASLGRSERVDQSINGVTVHARDFDDFVRQMDDRRRLAALGGRRAR